MKVLIDGVEYVPKAEVKPVDDDMIQGVLEVLTEMRYFNQNHKMMGLAYNALQYISPELADLDPKVAFDRVRQDWES